MGLDITSRFHAIYYSTSKVWQFLIYGGEIVEREIAGITVYEIVSNRMVLTLVWTHNGLAYTLYPPNAIRYRIDELCQSVKR